MAEVLMCEANVSEGRRTEVLEALVAAVSAIDGVRIADWSADADHNRAVITFVGEPELVLDAAKALAEAALSAIDMRTHQGEHPRQGALDVVPLSLIHI